METEPLLISSTPPIAPANRPRIHLEIVTQRNASRALVSRLLDIGTSAFSGDDAFGWRYPKRDQYPEYNRAMFWKFLSTDLLNPNVWVVVAFLPEGDKKVAVGYGTWERKGSIGKHESLRDSWLQKCERPLHAFQIKLTELLFPNPAAYKPAIDLMKTQFQKTEEHLATLPVFMANGQYHLNFLAVSPAYQRRGIGAEIVTWGVNKAREEVLPCSLEASMAGKKVYLKCGFHEIGICDPFHGEPWAVGMHCKEEGCQFAVGSFMIWDPHNKQNGVNAGNET